jgi:uncharacterized protein (UPF0276 family)
MQVAARAEFGTAAIPARAGIGLPAPHCREIIDTRPDIAWVEVHSENYFGDGGQPHHFLERVRRDYPLSLHGVGLGLGSASPLDRAHFDKLARLIDRYEPGLVSEHLCWVRPVAAISTICYRCLTPKRLSRMSAAGSSRCRAISGGRF